MAMLDELGSFKKQMLVFGIVFMSEHR